MENHSDEKTNASRRRFTKSIAAAAAALPLVSTLAGAQDGPRAGAAQRTDAQPQDRTPELRQHRNEHDTPPPVLVMSGSCILEIAADGDTVGPKDDSGGRRKYRVTPKDITGNFYLAHVKVVDGSGEMLFRLDNTTADPVEVILALSDTKEVRLAAEGGKLLIELEKTKKFDKKVGDPPMSAGTSRNKRTRFRYMDDAPGSAEPDIKFVRVFRKGRQLFDLELDTLRSHGEELKVMLWWEA